MSRVSIRSLRVLVGLVSVALPFFANSAWATEFRTTREKVIVYDSPSDRSKRLSILSKDYPVEVLDRDEDGWLKVRDMVGDIGWIEEASTSTRKRVIVRQNAVEAMRQPDRESRVAFSAEKGVVLERLTLPDEDGWLKVRIPNTKQEGYVRSTQVWGVDRKKAVSALRDDESESQGAKVVHLKSKPRVEARDDEDESVGSEWTASKYPRVVSTTKGAMRCQVYRDVNAKGHVSYRAVPVLVDSSKRRGYVEELPKATSVRYNKAKKTVATGKKYGGDELTSEQERRLIAAERARLRQRRLQAEQSKRLHSDDHDARRPVIYSRRNPNVDRDEWDYSDEDHSYARPAAAPKRIHD